MNDAERIKELRTERGLTVNKLANKAGISQSHLRDIELGNKQTTVEYLSYICDALGVSLEYFFCAYERDPLYKEVARLNDSQKQALYTFLQSIKN